MIPRWLKQSYYALLSPVMRLNAARHRLVPHPAYVSGQRVQLGPGQKKYLPGWVNVDANLFSSRPEIWADLRFKLPFRDNSVAAFYSHHVIEHLPDVDAHFRELYRCLQPGGVLRIGGPHGDNAMRAFLANDRDWFGDWPTLRQSMGGRFENFIFCKGEHLTILTESFLEELADNAGFVGIRPVAPRETGYPHYYDRAVMEMEEQPGERPARTVLIEASKPAS